MRPLSRGVVIRVAGSPVVRAVHRHGDVRVGLGLDAVGDVSRGRRDQETCLGLYRRQADLGRELSALFAKTREVLARIHGSRSRAFAQRLRCT